MKNPAEDRCPLDSDRNAVELLPYLFKNTQFMANGLREIGKNPLATNPLAKEEIRVIRVQSAAFNRVDPNQSLQLTAGSSGFINVFGVVAGFGVSDGLR